MKALFTAYVVIVSLQHDADLTLKIDVSNHDGDIQCVEGVAGVSPKSVNWKSFSLIYSTILSQCFFACTIKLWHQNNNINAPSQSMSHV